jgi:hypothetical protein
MRFTCNTRPRVWGGLGVAMAVVVASVLVETTLVFAEGNVIVIAAAPQATAPAAVDNEEKVTPEQKMNRRYPQPVRVGFLIGLPVLDWQDSTIGYIQHVVRTADGKIQLVVPYSPRFGWVRNGGALDRWRRPVAVPLETVAILARQVDALEMSRQDFDTAPTFQPDSASPLPADETIRIAIARR